MEANHLIVGRQFRNEKGEVYKLLAVVEPYYREDGWERPTASVVAVHTDSGALVFCYHGDKYDTGSRGGCGTGTLAIYEGDDTGAQARPVDQFMKMFKLVILVASKTLVMLVLCLLSLVVQAQPT